MQSRTIARKEKTEKKRNVGEKTNCRANRCPYAQLGRRDLKTETPG